jgi:hypothetical protein
MGLSMLHISYVLHLKLDISSYGSPLEQNPMQEVLVLVKCCYPGPYMVAVQEQPIAWVVVWATFDHLKLLMLWLFLCDKEACLDRFT